MNVLKELKKYNQDKILSHILKLSKEEKEIVIKQLETINPVEFEDIVRTAINGVKYDFENISIPNVYPHNFEEKKKMFEIGYKRLKGSNFGFIIAAGGQGSRLGFDKPKGMFPISPVKQKTLFQIHVEKIINFARYYKFNPFLFIMTSDTNYEETKKFFNENKNFGFIDSQIFIFKQCNLPALDNNYQLIFSDKTKLFTSPDGHGGIYKALKVAGLLDFMKSREINTLSYFQIDNPIAEICDPVFLGLHITNNSEVSLRVIKKNKPEDRLGNIAVINGKTHIIEYTELPDNIARLTNPDGSLKFKYGSISIYLFERSFIEKITSKQIKLPHHVARKKINYYDFDKKEIVKVNEDNGYKFEQFVFDALPFAHKVVFYEALREESYAPLKDKTGELSIENCRNGISNLYKKWLSEAGFDISKVNYAEISPYFAVCREELLDKKDKIKIELKGDVYIE